MTVAQVLTPDVLALIALVALVLLLGFSILYLTRPGTDIDEVCVEPGCFGPATHERFEGFIGPDEQVELVCRRHARGAVAMRRADV